MQDPWIIGDRYEQYVGRWSRLLAPGFLSWAGVKGGASVLDVGCGTGALSSALMEQGAARVVGVDPSETFVAHARERIPQATFDVGDAQSLRLPDGSFDAAVSALVLNFIPDAPKAAREMRRVVRPGGVVAASVWDYARGMEMMRHFWDAAAHLDPSARALDEARRFPICDPAALTSLFHDAGFAEVATSHIDQPTLFHDFDDFWTPFLGGQGPAPGYCMGLSEAARAKLRDGVRARLPIQADGTIPLVARAWTVRGIV